MDSERLDPTGDIQEEEEGASEEGAGALNAV